MKFIVIDMQGYNIPEFFPKELVFWDGKVMKSYCFKPTTPFHQLSEECKRQAKYLYREHHHIHYKVGDTEYQDIYSIICKNLRDVDLVYVKGDPKIKFLTKIYTEMKHKSPQIVNLETVHGSVPKLDKDFTACTYHMSLFCICSVNNVKVLYDYIIGFLPQ